MEHGSKLFMIPGQVRSARIRRFRHRQQCRVFVESNERNWLGRLVIACLFACVSGALSPDLFAQPTDTQSDRVVIQPNGKSGRLARQGTILDYTAKKMHFREGSGGAIRIFDSSEIVDWETPRNADHVKGIEEFGRHEFTAAEESFSAALMTEQRSWVRRDILALLVSCRLADRDYRGAGKHFLTMFRSQADCRHFDRIPLLWAPQLLDAETARVANQWLSASPPIEKLLGASLLLTDPHRGEVALAVLESLSANSDRRIQWLARAQRWRASLLQRPPSDFAIEDWRQAIEDMPRNLRGGPFYLLGRGHWMRREFDRAALAYLRVGLVHNQDAHLAARASLEAADALVEAGRPGDAEVIYREIQTRYPRSDFAQDAARVLQTGLKRSGDR